MLGSYDDYGPGGKLRRRYAPYQHAVAGSQGRQHAVTVYLDYDEAPSHDRGESQQAQGGNNRAPHMAIIVASAMDLLFKCYGVAALRNRYGSAFDDLPGSSL
jgi:hypothetical protein